MPKPFDPTQPVRTRDGRPARILCTDRIGDQPIIALTKTGTIEMLSYHYPDGRVAKRFGELCDYDLINLPEKHKLWLNIYAQTTWHYVTRELADDSAGTGRIACIEVEYEEGQGISNENK